MRIDSLQQVVASPSPWARTSSVHFEKQFSPWSNCVPFALSQKFVHALPYVPREQNDDEEEEAGDDEDGLVVPQHPARSKNANAPKIMDSFVFSMEWKAVLGIYLFLICARANLRDAHLCGIEYAHPPQCGCFLYPFSPNIITDHMRFIAPPRCAGNGRF